MKYLVDNWMSIAGLLFGLIGIILSYFFYKKSIRVKRPCKARRSFNLIRDSISKEDNITVMYKDKKIDNLTFSKVAFWNGGKETIKNTDIVNGHEVTISGINGGEILEYKIIYVKEDANNYRITFGDNKIRIEFEYVDFGQGILLMIIHSGQSSDNLKIDGKFKGTEFEAPHTSFAPSDFLMESTYYDDEQGKFYSAR